MRLQLRELFHTYLCSFGRGSSWVSARQELTVAQNSLAEKWYLIGVKICIIHALFKGFSFQNFPDDHGLITFIFNHYSMSARWI